MIDKYIKVIHFEDSSAYRESISLLLKSTSDIVLLSSYPDVIRIEKVLDQFDPDVILLDIDLPKRSGIDVIRTIKEKTPKTEIIMLTVFEDESKIFNTLRNGASGYILKNSNCNEIINAIYNVSTGGIPLTSNVAKKILWYFREQNNTRDRLNKYQLTPRETEILKELVNGNSYKLIANKLFISVDTVKYHVKNIYVKLHVNSKTEVVKKAINEKLIE